MPLEPPPTRRLFFALWPATPVALALEKSALAARRICGGRAMRRETLHLTLAFLGDIDAARLDSACDAARVAAAKVGAGETALILDQLGYWTHNRIVWAGCSAIPKVLSALAGELAFALSARDFHLERRPFAAHVTLLRNAGCSGPLPLPEPLSWSASEFVLVESQRLASGANYEILERWRLG